MTVSFESRWPYALEEKCVSLTWVLTSEPMLSVCRIIEIKGFPHTDKLAQERKPLSFDCARTVQEVGQIEIGDVIPNNHIRIDLLHKRLPMLKHVLLVLEREHLRTNNVRTRVEGEHIANKGLTFAYALREYFLTQIYWLITDLGAWPCSQFEWQDLYGLLEKCLSDPHTQYQNWGHEEVQSSTILPLVDAI
jgi:hypothetical protein